MRLLLILFLILLIFTDSQANERLARVIDKDGFANVRAGQVGSRSALAFRYASQWTLAEQDGIAKFTHSAAGEAKRTCIRFWKFIRHFVKGTSAACTNPTPDAQTR